MMDFLISGKLYAEDLDLDEELTSAALECFGYIIDFQNFTGSSIRLCEEVYKVESDMSFYFCGCHFLIQIQIFCIQFARNQDIHHSHFLESG